MGLDAGGKLLEGTAKMMVSELAFMPEPKCIIYVHPLVYQREFAPGPLTTQTVPIRRSLKAIILWK